MRTWTNLHSIAPNNDFWWLWLQPWQSVLSCASTQHFCANQRISTQLHRKQTNKQKTIVVSSLKVGVNGLVTIYFAYQVLCDEASWHTNAASSYSNLKIISLFPVLTHRRQFLQQSEKGHADSSVFFTTWLCLPPTQAYLICRMRQSPQG